MSKLNKILLILAAVLIVISAGVLYWQKAGLGKPYWAVYTSDGNIYFGKISNFPRFALANAWFLQGADGSAELTISKFSESVWGPSDKIYINPDNIIWKTKLREDSQLLPRFEGK
jgi:hypothetical protein